MPVLLRKAAAAAGVVAAMGALALTASGSEKTRVITIAPGEDDPFAPAWTKRKAIEKQLSIRVEFIRVDHTELSALLRAHGSARDKKWMRRGLWAMIENGGAELVETIWTRTTGDSRARAMSIVEFIYPTEGDPPEVPDQLKLKGAPSAGFHGTSQSSTAYETREVGPQLDADASLGPEREWISLLFNLEYHEEPKVDYHTPDDDTDSELKNRWMPAFHKVHVSTALVMKDGSWAVAGIHTPRDDESKRVVALIRASVLK